MSRRRRNPYEKRCAPAGAYRLLVETVLSRGRPKALAQRAPSMLRGRGGVTPSSLSRTAGEGAERSEAGEGARQAKDPHPAAGFRPRPPSPAVRERGYLRGLRTAPA